MGSEFKNFFLTFSLSLSLSLPLPLSYLSPPTCQQLNQVEGRQVCGPPRLRWVLQGVNLKMRFVATLTRFLRDIKLQMSEKKKNPQRRDFDLPFPPQWRSDKIESLEVVRPSLNLTRKSTVSVKRISDEIMITYWEKKKWAEERQETRDRKGKKTKKSEGHNMQRT